MMKTTSGRDAVLAPCKGRCSLVISFARVFVSLFGWLVSLVPFFVFVSYVVKDLSILLVICLFVYLFIVSVVYSFNHSDSDYSVICLFLVVYSVVCSSSY